MKSLYTLLFVLLATFGKAQQLVNHHVDFASGNQNMWGPSWSAFSMNQEITLFEVDWDENFDTGNGGIATILGQQFGAAIDGNFTGLIGSKFSLLGFTTGEVNVEYPIDITLDMPTDLTYDQGDEVTIQTDYEVDSGHNLETMYPAAGEAKLDLYFSMGASLNFKICMFGCTSFPVIPAFDTGVQNINIFTVNQNEVTFFGFNDLDPLFSYSIFPFSTDQIPNDPLGEFGLSAELDVPYVETTHGLSGDDLRACGEDLYSNITLDIFALLGNIPGPVGAVLGNLSGSQEIGPAEIYWNLFSTSLAANNFNKQCFDFEPRVYGEFEFPLAVIYEEVTPAGAVVNSGESSIISVELGNDLRYKFPCYYEELDIIPTYSIIGDFTNHTYDSIAFQVDMSAFAFGLLIPEIEITPSITVPEICLNIPYPCPTWSKPWKWCSSRVCTPSFTIPAITFPEFSLDFGPLWEHTIPLGYVSYDWYKNTWELEGFSEYTFPAFRMIASPLSIAVNHLDVSCYNGVDGEISVTPNAISHALPYSYEWTDGSTTQNIANLEAGPYEVSAYDDNGCQLFTGATIIEPEQPVNMLISKSDKLCNGGLNNGSIDIFTQGGTPNYTYLWSNGSTAEDITGLATGNYSLTVTDSRGCTGFANVDIEEPNVLLQNGLVNNVKCFGGVDGSIDVSGFGGTLPYSYTWDSGDVSQDLVDKPAGDYTLTITDANNCTSTGVHPITQPISAIALGITGNDVLCKLDSTGSVNLTVNGGTPNYNYQWVKDGSIVLPYVTPILSNISAGTYSVIVTDENGCTEEIQQDILEPANSLSSTPILTEVLCKGFPTGQIDPVVDGGTIGYTYTWSNGASANTVSGLVGGNYDLQIEDAHNCVANFSYFIDEPEEILDGTLNSTDIKCFGDASGEISSEVSGGTGIYNYTWSNGSNENQITGLTAGNYTLLVTDENGCTYQDAANLVDLQPALALSSAQLEVDCKGNNSGAIDLTVAGGLAPYTFQWSTSGSVILADQSEDITAVVADNYTVLVTDSYGCEELLSQAVNEPTNELAVSSIIDDVDCYLSSDGGIDLSTTGGTAPYSFAWSSGETTEDINSISSNTYQVTITDSRGCILSDSYFVNQPEDAVVSTLDVNHVNCFGGADGFLQASTVGGTSPYTYAWSNGSTDQNVYALQAGTYSLTTTDAQGCIAFTGSQITEPVSALILTATTQNVSCFQGSDGSVEIDVFGGVQPYYFNWGDENELLFSNENDFFGNLTVGDYFVRVTDANGCIEESILTITEPDLLTGSIITTDAICYADANGTMDLTVVGGTQAYSYQWSNGETTEDLSYLIAGEYEVEVTDFNGCVFTDAATIYQPDSLGFKSSTVDVSCVDQSDGEIFISPFGGTIPYYYDWSNGIDEDSGNELESGYYIITVSDDHFCEVTDTIIIRANSSECLFIPNTITPNGDDYNDTWILDNIYLYPNANVKIFNKWGNLMHESNGEYVPWNGTHKGSPLPSAVYYYVITLGNETGNEYSGTLTIIY